MNIPNLTYNSYLLISAPKIDTDLLWDLSLLFIGLAVMYFLGVFFYRNKISSNSKKVGDRKRELSPMISEFLFLEDDASKDEKSNYIALKIEIRQLLKDPFNRRVLSEVLLDLRRDISGETQQSLFRLYQDLGLDKDAFAKLKGWRWQIISKGILELTQMEVAESYGFITKFINDKRSTIRKQAEIATVTLRQEGINYFLDTTKYKISEWQQLKLLDVIRNKEDFQPPRFKAWLTSNNKYVVLFALRLIKYYNQNDANASLIELVKHKNNQIKEEAIGCIKEFYVTESLNTLKMVFWNCSIDVKIAILDAIAQIGSQTDIEFLNLIDKKELNFSVKSKALSSINAISPESIMPSKGIQDESRYKIPDDITEAVAKVHAKKHEALSGEKDEEFIDEEITYEQPLTEEAKEHPVVEENYEPDMPDEEITLIDEDMVQKAQLSEEIATPHANEENKDLYDIEVEVEQEIKNEEESSYDDELDHVEWKADHLNFLPLVVSENEIGQEPINTNKTMPPSSAENLYNIEVIDEEPVQSGGIIDSEESATTENTSSFFEEFNIRELSFLPIVVESESEIQDDLVEKFEDEKTDLLGILVQYDEIQPSSPEEKIATDTLIKELEIDYSHPHEHRDMDLSEHSKSSESPDYMYYDTDEIRNTGVIYEEVLGKEEEIELLEIDVIEPYVLTSDINKEKTSEMTFEQEEENEEIEIPIENEQLLQKIIDDLISFDNKTQEKDTKIEESYINPDWDLDESDLDFIPVSFDEEEKQLPKYIKVEKAQSSTNDEEVSIPKASIPKAIFGDIEFEASTRQLLNDLEEMGDQREIPFLKELLAHEKYDLFKVRINNLIDTFNHSKEIEIVEDLLQPFSVFQDLFRTCDHEAKLILLNEVVEVGDEKEIHFLEDLTKDDSLEIREKALEVLKGLKTKLGKKQDDLKHQDSSEKVVLKPNGTFNQMEVSDIQSSSDPDDMFDLNFDLTEDVDEKKKMMKNESAEEQDSVQYGSFFGHICSFSHKIMEKLNG